jgi:hypothetical protein
MNYTIKGVDYMTLLIDARTSMGMSMSNGSGDLIEPDTSILIGQVGLTVPASASGIIRVIFNGIAGIQLPTDPIITADISLTLVNGVLPTDRVVYQSFSTYSSVVDSPNFNLIPLSASDYDVPPPESGLLIYSLFLKIEGEEIGILRAGPENFTAIAYTDN